MAIHELITLGIGDNSDIPSFILGGLDPSGVIEAGDGWSSLSGLSGLSGGGNITQGTEMSRLGLGSKPVFEFLAASKLNAAANTAAVITIPGVGERYTVVDNVSWSYSGNPSPGKLTISGGVTNKEWDITVGGPGSLDVTYVGLKGANVVITLAAGGAGITGKVNADYTVEL